MALTEDEIDERITKAARKAPDLQRAVIGGLTRGERDKADLIMSARRFAGGHGESPVGGSDTLCDSCGRLSHSNPRVRWAWHPAEFG